MTPHPQSSRGTSRSESPPGVVGTKTCGDSACSDGVPFTDAALVAFDVGLDEPGLVNWKWGAASMRQIEVSLPAF
jgi:hypothetical protein